MEEDIKLIRIKNMKNNKKLIDLDLFDSWLEKERYIYSKFQRKRIIAAYKRMFNNYRNIFDLENELDKMGWDEITYNDIMNYIVFPEYRLRENKKVLGGQK